MTQGTPDFIIIGAMKSGTTSLFRHLGRHPGVFMSSLKEPCFFIKKRNWSKGHDWYRSLFDGAPEGALLGEGSTSYSKSAAFPGVPELLRSEVPDVKLIYLLRDPLQRMRSHHAHAVFKGREKRPIERAITARSGYLRTSLYGAELQRYRSYFPADQIHVILTEDLAQAPAEVLSGVVEFLGLPDYEFPGVERRYHVSSNRKVNTRLGEAVQRHRPLDTWSRRYVPEQVRDRLLTRGADTEPAPLPENVVDRVRKPLLADRALLQSQVDLDLSSWADLRTTSR
nr:sulfotransferase [Microlunatus soli]